MFVLTVIIFLEPKYSTPKTDPLRPPSLVNERFSGRIPKKFLLLLDVSNCFGILKLASSILMVDCSFYIPSLISIKFIPGDPIKDATNLVLGLLYIILGSSACKI